MRNRPIVVGIVNVTPDSFYDGGRHGDGLKQTAALIEAGADWIDVGGESTRPGAQMIDGETEWNRVRRVIETFAHSIPISIDTSKSSVAAKALRAGASIINDVTGLSDPEMVNVTADAEHTVVMHMRGTPQTMNKLTDYGDLTQDICAWLCERAARAQSNTVWIDPGIGFAKTAGQSLSLLKNTGVFVATGHPVFIGASRKSFIGHTLDVRESEDRLAGSLAAVASAWQQGAEAFRVHDVAETRHLLDMLHAIEGAA